MELAAALHHSRDVGPGTNDGLRAQTTASSGSGRRLLWRWPSRRWEQSRSVTWLPPGLSWWWRRLAGGVSFLLRENLRRIKEEEEKERRRVEEVKAAEKHKAKMQLLSEKIRHDVPLTEAEWAAWYQWKKRKKRGLPRVPRHGGRRPRGHAARVPAVLRVPGASVCSSSECWTFLLCHRDGYDVQSLGWLLRARCCATTGAMVSGSGMCKAYFAGFSRRDVLPSIFGRPRCLASWPVWFPTTLCI